MIGGLLKGFFTFIFAFMLGAGFAQDKPAADSELQAKVQEHMDVIVDESAAIVDDVMEEVRQNEHVQEMQQFADDVNEIVDNTRNDIQAHFGTEETAEDTQDAVTPETEAAADAGTEDSAAAAEESEDPAADGTDAAA